MVDDLDLSGIADPDARHLLGVVVERLQRLVREQQAMRLAHDSLQAAYQVVVAENAALSE